MWRFSQVDRVSSWVRIVCGASFSERPQGTVWLTGNGSDVTIAVYFASPVATQAVRAGRCLPGGISWSEQVTLESNVEMSRLNFFYSAPDVVVEGVRRLGVTLRRSLAAGEGTG